MSKIILTKSTVGQLDLTGGTVNITDPCYNKDVWCRINDKPVIPGVYACNCFVGEEACWGTRVWITQIVLENHELSNNINERIASNKWRKIGEIGVDAGLAGFFSDKPDFSREEWLNLCDWIFAKEKKGERGFVKPYGFWTQSGCGDGCYPVYAIFVNGKIGALEIRF